MLTVLEHLWLWFLLYSFAGWIYESVLISVQERRLVNRGFLNGPLCPIYGTGALLMVMLLHGIGNPLIVFILSAVVACVLEYVTSWVMEALFHARWWDYSNMRFNINGRICLLGAIVFGFGGVFVVQVLHPLVEGWTGSLDTPVLHWICAVTLLLMAADTMVTVAGIADFEPRIRAFTDFVQEHAARAGETWQWGRRALLERLRDLSGTSSDRIARLRSDVVSMLSRQQRRMIRSFPHLRFRSVGDNSVLDTIREAMRRRR